MEEKISAYLEHGFLAMAVIASVNCLARTDFNFPFALLFYYLWHRANTQESMDKANIGRKLLILNVVIGVLDLIWLIVMGSVWHSTPDENVEAWESLSGMHSFVLFFSWINWILRVSFT